MAKTKSKFPKHLSQAQVQAILTMKPEDLSVEAARGHLALETFKEQLKGDHQISDLTAKKEDLEDAAKKSERVQQARAAYEEIYKAELGDEYENVKQDLKALRGAWREEGKKRRSEVKFMMKTLKSHMEVGLLKSKLD